MAERDEELQHGSTVLPGAPMPWFAQPHGAQPGPPDAGPPTPEPTPEPLAEQPDEAVVEQPDEPVVEDEQPSAEEVGDVEPVTETHDAPPADDHPADEAAEPTTPEPTEAAASDGPAVDADDAAVVAAAAPAHGRHRAPEPDKPGSRRLLVLLLILGAVLVIAAVVLFVWPGLLTSSSADDSALPASAAPAAPSPSAPATVTLVVPATLAGLAKLSGAADAALRGAVSGTAVAGLTSPVSGVYGSKGVASAQVIAWKAMAPPAQDSVDAAFTGFEGSSGAKVTAVRPLAAGTLGGRMSCGETTVSKTPSLLCFWADEVSFGSVTLLSPKDRAAAEATAVKIRAGVEQKG